MKIVQLRDFLTKLCNQPWGIIVSCDTMIHGMIVWGGYSIGSVFIARGQETLNGQQCALDREWFRICFSAPRRTQCGVVMTHS